MKRPLFVLVVFYIVGVVLGRFVPFGAFFVLFFGVVSVLSVYLSKFTYKIISVLFLIFFCIGYFNCYKNYNHNFDFISEDNKVLLNGYVADLSYTSTLKPKVVFEVFETRIENKIYKVNYKVLCYLNEEDKVSTGQNLIISGNLLFLDESRNPDAYNEKLNLLSKKIKYKMFADTVVKGKISTNYKVKLNNFRNKLLNVYDSVLPKKEASIMHSMVVGYSKDLNEEIKELYKINGIYHILSISGLHIAVMAIAIETILKRFLNPKLSGIIIALFLILYCIFTGASSSCVRAVIMYLVIVLGNIIYRDKDLLTSLAFSALLILLYEPLIFWDIGFQLSFSAVLGIGIAYEPIFRFVTKILKIKNEMLKSSMSIFISVNIFTAPISAFYFYYFNSYGIFANLIILPTVSFLLIIGILIGLIGLINLNIALFFSGIVYYMLKIYEFICSFFASLPFANILIGKPKISYLILYTILIFLIISMLKDFGQKYFLYKKLVIACLFLFPILIFAERSFNTELKITMLDVGQGDAFVISKKNNVFIIDCGDNPSVIINYLKKERFSKIRGIFLSHTDSDHAEAILEIADNFKVENIFLSKRDYSEDELFISLSKKIPEKTIKYIKNDDIINLDEIYFNCLFPFENSNYDSNDGSLVIKLTYNKISFLFTGDIGFIPESKLNENISSDVLKIAHHGSKNSTSEEFLKKVNPKVSLISVGRNNHYGHPDKRVIDELEKIKSVIFRTDNDGAVIFTTDGEKLKYRKMIQ